MLSENIFSLNICPLPIFVTQIFMTSLPAVSRLYGLNVTRKMLREDHSSPLFANHRNCSSKKLFITGGVGLHVHVYQSISCHATRGPSIYDVHTEGEGSGSGGRMWTGGSMQPHVDVHTEN